MSNLPVVVGHGFDSPQFLLRVHEAPFLSAEEEYRLAIRFQQDQDTHAAHELVFSHLRLVVKTAREYLGYKLPFQDLVQEGTLGLMQAVKRFDPERKVRLATYAVWWIRAAIHEYVLNAWSMVKIATTRMKKKLFFKLRQAKKSISFLTDDEAEELAEQFGTDVETILEMDGRMAGHDHSLNIPAIEDGVEVIDLIADQRPDQERLLIADQRDQILSNRIRTALGSLNERERIIVSERCMAENPVTLDNLGHRFGISRERVRQIEKRALEKLQDVLRSSPAIMEVALGT